MSKVASVLTWLTFSASTMRTDQFGTTFFHAVSEPVGSRRLTLLPHQRIPNSVSIVFTFATSADVTSIETRTSLTARGLANVATQCGFSSFEKRILDQFPR